jgi:hypothetical protein
MYEMSRMVGRVETFSPWIPFLGILTVYASAKHFGCREVALNGLGMPVTRAPADGTGVLVLDFGIFAKFGKWPDVKAAAPPARNISAKSFISCAT